MSPSLTMRSRNTRSTSCTHRRLSHATPGPPHALPAAVRAGATAAGVQGKCLAMVGSPLTETYAQTTLSDAGHVSQVELVEELDSAGQEVVHHLSMWQAGRHGLLRASAMLGMRCTHARSVSTHWNCYVLNDGYKTQKGP
eukprot:1161047-Pelagomonas_calceolata.AAC.38